MGNNARLDALGLSIGELAAHLCVTRQYIVDWLTGALRPEELDVIEVGVSLLEMQFGASRRNRDVPTERIVLVA
jgi:hypothetical protein